MSGRIAVLTPMPPELAPLRRPLALRHARSGVPGLFTGTRGSLEIVACITGIGFRAAAAATERVLDAAKIDRVVVVGIAGGIGPGMAIGDLVVPERVLDVASGAEHRPAPLGDVAPRGVLASADGMLSDLAAIAALGRRGAVAIDMETAAVAAVCERRGHPWSVFRAISDRADDGSTDTAIFELAKPDGTPNLPAVARLLLTQPGRIPQLIRLARGMKRAAHTAASHTVRALDSSSRGRLFPS